MATKDWMPPPIPGRDLGPRLRIGSALI